MNPIQDLTNQLDCHLFSVDINNIILSCNRTQAMALGLESEKGIAGTPLEDVVGEPVLTHLKHNNQRVVKEKKSIIVEEGLVNSAGVYKCYISYKNPVYDDQGEVCAVVGVSFELPENAIARYSNRDYTRILKRVEQLGIYNNLDVNQPMSINTYVDAIQEYYESIINLLPGNVYWFDKKGYMLGCNANLANSMGYRYKRDIIGKNLMDVFPTGEAEALLAINRHVIKTGKPISLEESSTMREAEKRTYFTTKSPLLSTQGDIIGIVGTSLDITQRKVVEEELIQARQDADMANQYKSEFLMNMSHDLRTPCSGILGFSKILYDNEIDPKKKQQIDYIIKSSSHLLSLLSEIVDYTKVESTGYVAKHNIVNLPGIIQSVHELLLAEIQKKQLQFTIDYLANVPEDIIIDGVIIHRVLLNLLSNALKFTNKGSIVVEVSWDNNNSEIILSVSDTGIGIAKEHHDFIFHVFTRLSSSFTGEHQGAGLGLATVTHLLNSVGGRVKLKSELGQGSEFVCYIPIELPESSAEALSLIDSAEDQLEIQSCFDFKNNPGIRVLVIEDDLISSKVCQTLFEKYAVKLHMVHSGQQALQEFTGEYDLIIMDIGLPDMSGFDLVQKIRKKTQHDARITIIALTAHIDKSYKKQCIAKGFDCLMQKPITRETIEKL